MSTTTTTTTEEPKTTTTTTVDAAQAQHSDAEKQGEVQIDKNADAHTLKEQSADERLSDARAEGLRNHEVEHAHDADTNDGDPTTRDKE